MHNNNFNNVHTTTSKLQKTITCQTVDRYFFNTNKTMDDASSGTSM